MLCVKTKKTKEKNILKQEFRLNCLLRTFFFSFPTELVYCIQSIDLERGPWNEVNI